MIGCLIVIACHCIASSVIVLCLVVLVTRLSNGKLRFVGSRVMGCGVSKNFTDWTDEVTEDVKKSFDSVLQIVGTLEKLR